ncbi:MAG: ABC transporter permease subunit [Planctomycetota bacterium]
MKRLIKNRAWRKLFRNRLAVASMFVVGVYFAVALFSFAGGITRQDTQKRVLPDKFPGWFEQRTLDDRALDAEWLIERVAARIERAPETEDPRRTLDEVSLGERRVAELSIDELQSIVDDAYDRLDGLFEVLDEKDFILDEVLDKQISIERLQEREGMESRIAELNAEIEELKAELPPFVEAAAVEMEKVDEVLLQLMPMPTGLDGFVYGTRTFLGSDAQGRSIAMKAFYSTRIAFQIGLVVAVVCVIIGTLAGAAAGYFGGWVDYIVMYVVSVLSSIPTLVLLGVLVYMFAGSTVFDNPAEKPGLALVPVYAAMCMTYWISTCRVIRGEVMRIKELEYVQAATTIGFTRPYILLRHVIPNTAHLMFINLSLLFIGAIKSEVILSFLGLGVKGQPSWGTMISQAKEDVSTYFFWEVGTASLMMFGLVLAFNILSDALQDAFDPKHVS